MTVMPDINATSKIYFSSINNDDCRLKNLLIHHKLKDVIEKRDLKKIGNKLDKNETKLSIFGHYEK